MENINKPQKTYKSGLLSLSVWENEIQSEGEQVTKVKTFTIKRSYKDKEEWKQTQMLRTQDLPRLKVLIDEAYKEEVLKSE